MQKVMQEDCAVFRTGEILEEGVKRIDEVWTRLPTTSRSPTVV